jgi:hypothetical protein
VEQTLSCNNQASIIGGIGSIYVLVFGILQMLNNYLTKNSEDVVMASKLYTVKNNTDLELGDNDKEQVLNAIKAR